MLSIPASHPSETAVELITSTLCLFIFDLSPITGWPDWLVHLLIACEKPVRSKVVGQESLLKLTVVAKPPPLLCLQGSWQWGTDIVLT